jgi:hypothetical protein
MSGSIWDSKVGDSQGESAAVLRGRDLLESTAAVAQPHDHIFRVQEVSPNQIGCTVIIDILSEQGAVFDGVGIKVQNHQLASAAQKHFDALARARAGNSRLINETVGVEIRECNRLAETKRCQTF